MGSHFHFFARGFVDCLHSKRPARIHVKNDLQLTACTGTLRDIHSEPVQRLVAGSRLRLTLEHVNGDGSLTVLRCGQDDGFPVW